MAVGCKHRVLSRQLEIEHVLDVGVAGSDGIVYCNGRGERFCVLSPPLTYNGNNSRTIPWMSSFTNPYGHYRNNKCSV